MLHFLPVTHSHALVVSGIRRCGKSVLLHQFISNDVDDVFYFNSSKYNKESFVSYLEQGGFPEFLKIGNSEVLSFLIEDIIHRDIATRYAIRDVSGLKRLCVYMMSNTAKLVSPSKLTSVIGVKSSSTVLEYLAHFESSYLLNLVPRFSWSVKGQMLSEKKVYVVDNGLVNVASISASKNYGRKFENTVYWSIRRKTKHIWYFADGHSECDFIYKLKEEYSAIQVCFEINGDNQERELNGLLSALRFFKLREGTILTIDQRDKILVDGCTINVVPAFDFLPVALLDQV